MLAQWGILVYIYTGLLQSCFRCYGFSIELLTIVLFVCKPDASWGCWAGKCCYSYLFCVLEQWLLHLPHPRVRRVVWEWYPSLRPGLLCGNNLDRARGILDDWRHRDVYVVCLWGSIAMCVSLQEDVWG